MPIHELALLATRKLFFKMYFESCRIPGFMCVNCMSSTTNQLPVVCVSVKQFFTESFEGYVTWFCQRIFIYAAQSSASAVIYLLPPCSPRQILYNVLIGPHVTGSSMVKWAEQTPMPCILKFSTHFSKHIHHYLSRKIILGNYYKYFQYVVGENLLLKKL